VGYSVGHWKSKGGGNWESESGGNWSGKRSSNRGYKGSSWEMKTSIENELRIGIGVTLVKTVDRLVAVARERASIARCKAWSVCLGVCVRGIAVHLAMLALSLATATSLSTVFTSVTPMPILSSFSMLVFISQLLPL
jgi:hypothetical protein